MTKNPNLLKTIQNGFNRMSKGQKIIAEYIINNYDKAAFMTAANLGNTLSVSESTVVRFANALGYSGYRDLQKELQEIVKNKLTTVQRLSIAKDGYSSSSNESLIRAMESDIDNIKKTISDLDFNSLSRASRIMVNCRTIYVMGLRSSTFLAGYLCFYLNFLFPNVKLVTSGANDILEQLTKVTKDDVVIAITFPRYSKKTLDALDYVKTKGCNIISVTDSLISPAAGRSDITLIARSDMISFIDSLVAPMSLINALIISLGNEMNMDIIPYFEDLEKIWKTYSIYGDSSDNSEF